MFTVDALTLEAGAQVLAQDVSFSLEEGECVLLAGPNGAGKTTLLKALSQREGVSMIPTGIPKVKGFRVRDFLRTSLYRESGWAFRLGAQRERDLSDAAARTGIVPLLERDLSTLSDGEFQKACVAAALVRRSKVLLLDEPTAFLDVDGRMCVLRTLRAAADRLGLAVLFTSHDLSVALPMADRVFVLTRDHRFLASGRDDKTLILREAFNDYLFES